MKGRKRQEQRVQVDLVDPIDEILKPTLANVEAREVLSSILEPLIGVLSAAREHAGTLPGALLAAFIRDIVDDLLPQSRQVLSDCLEELQEALPHQTRASRSNRERIDHCFAAENLHKFGEEYGNRSTQCPDLDDAFFEKLEAGHVAFCPHCRGKIEGLIDTYWTVCQDKKKDRSRAKAWRRKWSGIAKQAGSLAASLKATGVFKDEMWSILNFDAKIGVNPTNVIALLEAISSSNMPPRPCRNENQDARTPAGATVPTARSVGYGLGHLMPVLNALSNAYKVAKRRANEGNARERRGSAGNTDWLLKALAKTYAMAGGSVAMHWDKRDKTQIVGGPFARFLWMVWEVLPPAGRPRSPETFARRAKDQILPQFSTDLKLKRCPDCALIALERPGRRAQMAK